MIFMSAEKCNALHLLRSLACVLCLLSYFSWNILVDESEETSINTCILIFLILSLIDIFIFKFMNLLHLDKSKFLCGSSIKKCG